MIELIKKLASEVEAAHLPPNLNPMLALLRVIAEFAVTQEQRIAALEDRLSKPQGQQQFVHAEAAPAESAGD